MRQFICTKDETSLSTKNDTFHRTRHNNPIVPKLCLTTRFKGRMGCERKSYSNFKVLSVHQVEDSAVSQLAQKMTHFAVLVLYYLLFITEDQFSITMSCVDIRELSLAKACTCALSQLLHWHVT